MNESFDQALTQLNALHAEDPRRVDIDGEPVAKELWHAHRMSAWLFRLCESPDELLQLAVSAQHLKRWEVPRSDYPEGRIGYLTWRRDQGRRAGEIAARVLRENGYADEDARRVEQLVRKQGLGRDAETQAVEDCACLVFLEHYFADFSRQVERDHLIRIVQKTWGKMSEQARALALELPMSQDSRTLVEEALEG